MFHYVQQISFVIILNEPCSCAGFFLLSEGVFLFEVANVFGKQFFFLTTTMTAIVAITKMNRMMRATAVIIPASEILSKLITLSFRIYKPEMTTVNDETLLWR